MNLKVLFALGLYWSVIIILFNVDASNNLIISSGYTTTAAFNTSAFQSTEIDEGGFLGGIFGEVVGIATAMGRFFIFATFGITAVALPTSLQYIFTIWSIFISTFTVGFIISSLWNG